MGDNGIDAKNAGDLQFVHTVESGTNAKHAEVLESVHTVGSTGVAETVQVLEFKPMAANEGRSVLGYGFLEAEAY